MFETAKKVNGLHIVYLPVNQAFALMWNESILRILNTRAEAETEMQDLLR